MSQDIFESIDPAISGSDLAVILNDFKDAVVSGMSGTSRPTVLEPGGYWIDTTNSPTTWSFRLWTGADDVEVFKIDLSGGGSAVSLAVDSFSVRKVSADTVGAVLELVKRRIANNGQVLSGDIVGEIRAVGRTNTGSNPVVAKIVFTADENQSDTAYGGTLSFYSTKAGDTALAEHMRFINGIVETIVPLRINSQVLVGQEVATASVIRKLSASKTLVEMTGAIPTEIRGIDFEGDTKVITIHNKSSVAVVLKNMSDDAFVVEEDKLSLPGDKDVAVAPKESVTLLRSEADDVWKMQYRTSRFGGFSTETITETEDFVVPAGVTQVRVTAIQNKSEPYAFKEVRFVGGGLLGLCFDGKVYSWGDNSQGRLGLGDTAHRSSPVLIPGLPEIARLPFFGSRTGAIQHNGIVRAWGDNAYGQLGVGDTLNKSTPTTILGSARFDEVGGVFGATLALQYGGVAYAWGENTYGQLGVGNAVDRSSPTAVAGTLRFRKVLGGESSFGLLEDGTAYAWGANFYGTLGVGAGHKSSPTLVVGGIKFRDLVPSFLDSRMGIAMDGNLYAWGENLYGSLGLGDNTKRSSPVAVTSVGITKKVVSTGQGWIALGSTGSLRSWGNNSRGELGLGDTTPRSSSVAVLGGLFFKDVISSEIQSTLALTRTGEIYAWGRNDCGQLGLGDTADRSSPTLVVGGVKFKELVSTGFNSFAISEDGRLYSWGANDQGNLGLGDTVYRSTPTLVLGKSIKENFSTFDIPVIPGATIPVDFSNSRCYFGATFLGEEISEVQIEYANP